MVNKNVQLLQDVLAGDVDAIKELRNVGHDDLMTCALDMGDLLITKAAVIKVLNTLKEGSSNLDDAQAWASFVRRGYFPSNSFMPITPLAIMNSPSDDEAIADAVSRLDEIGDLVDGVLESDEISTLVDSLNNP